MPEEKQIWVFGDLRNDRFFGYSLNVLAKAGELARCAGGRTALVILGSSSVGREAAWKCLEIGDCAGRAAAGGADYVFTADDPALALPRADIYSRVLAAAVSRHNPMLVLFPLTDFARDLAARAARLASAGLIADCEDLEIQDGRVIASCPSWGGRIMARISFSQPDRTGFATVQPHICAPAVTPGNPGKTAALDGAKIEIPAGLELVASEPEPRQERDLAEAEVVVAGGAGLGTADGFAGLRELAGALGGQLGATRPPVANHWIDENRLIGQTGKTVRPRLLVSVGTSGAVQYTAGIAEAGTIVAVNRDRNAPIFETADIGIVADAKSFVPLMTGRVKQSLMRKLAEDVREGQADKGRSSFGRTVRKMREAHEWSLEALAQATGQSPDFIEQVENDGLTPSVAFLLRLARVLGVDPGAFLGQEEKAAIKDQRAKAFIKRTQNYSYESLTPEAETEHLRSFLVTIESHQDHKPVAYKHEGEEFIYVMEGDLELTLGGKVILLRAGESKRFNSEIPHKLKSLSDTLTRCLVVLYTP